MNYYVKTQLQFESGLLIQDRTNEAATPDRDFWLLGRKSDMNVQVIKASSMVFQRFTSSFE